MTALLALEDGRVFRGEAFGATGTVTGEICFNTSLCGYQEVLTDPSYFGQIVAMTNPHIGNYGVNVLDEEAHGPQVRGFVIEELSDVPSNWRSEESLHEYLRRNGIPGIQEVDTRALTKHLRELGAMKACLTTEAMTPEQAVDRAKKGDGVVGMDFVRPSRLTTGTLRMRRAALGNWPKRPTASVSCAIRSATCLVFSRPCGIAWWLMISA